MTSLTTSFSPLPSPSACRAEAAPDFAAAILWALLGEGGGAEDDAPKAVTPGPPTRTTAKRAPNTTRVRAPCAPDVRVLPISALAVPLAAVSLNMIRAVSRRVDRGLVYSPCTVKNARA